MPESLCLEYKVDTHDWTFFVPLLQSSWNHTPVPSLGNKAPVELFCGLPIPSPLQLCFDSRQKKLLQLPEQPDAIATWLEQLRNSIRDLHKPMIAERARQAVRNQRKQKKVQRPNFDVGDYVFRSRVDQKHYDKLLGTWVGPYQVVRADAHRFAVRHLLTGEEMDVHPSRLKFYADQSLDVTAEVREHIAAQGLILSVRELKEDRWDQEKKYYEVLVSWKGLESIEDSWEQIAQLVKDIPVLLAQFAAKSNDRQFAQHVAAGIKPRSEPIDRPPPNAQRAVRGKRG
ncbi:unnamed protein product [Phytophthora fragariaefolia]|uniref:Unnamed protein product n=1 Tax=Phytophthora fragariaefolia TaxID=1490495 RepID=A0A9W6Y589_9STRA|nr:unnamed protein product [Phytophthora fragariaefolia]